MSRYIEYEPLMAELERDVELADDWNTAHEIANVVKYAPTIDAVEVVRCKDCRHNPKYTHDYMYGQCVFCCEDDWYSGTPEDDDYCSYGERKETDHE